MTELTVASLGEALPEKLKVKVTQSLVDTMNSCITDPEQAAFYRENLIGYSTVLHHGRFTMEQYGNAVAYVSFKLLGNTDVAAYSMTFPDKMQALQAKGATPKDISAYVHAYKGGKLVTALLEQALVPVHVANADIYQRAINTQANLMVSAKSEMVRTQAANSLMIQLKPPETTKVELDLGERTSSLVQDLKATLGELAAKQGNMLDNGQLTTKEVAEGRIINSSCTEADD